MPLMKSNKYICISTNLFIFSLSLMYSANSYSSVDSVVYIECVSNTGKTSKSSGVLISEQGHVITANHGIPEDGTCEGNIGSAEKKHSLIAQRYRVDGFDMALLRFAKLDGDIPALAELCELDDAMKGEPIIVAGFPKDSETLQVSLRTGILSNTFRTADGVVETDALTARGMSGGPVFTNDLARLIGIVLGVEYDVGNGEPNYYGVLPFTNSIAIVLGFDSIENKCFESRNMKLDSVSKQWRSDQSGVTQLEVNPRDAFCFLKLVKGQFDHPADSVFVDVRDGFYVIGGSNGGGEYHSAEAMCVKYK